RQPRRHPVEHVEHHAQQDQPRPDQEIDVHLARAQRAVEGDLAQVRDGGETAHPVAEGQQRGKDRYAFHRRQAPGTSSLRRDVTQDTEKGTCLRQERIENSDPPPRGAAPTAPFCFIVEPARNGEPGAVGAGTGSLTSPGLPATPDSCPASPNATRTNSPETD